MEVTDWQGIKQIRVDEYASRLVESAYEIFSFWQIHSDLTTNAAVNLGKKRCWDLDKINSPQKRRGHKAGKISHDAAAQSHNQIRPGHSKLGTGPDHGFKDRKSLMVLPMRENKPANHKAFLGKFFFERFAIKGIHRVIRNDSNLFGFGKAADLCPDILPQTSGNFNGIGILSECNINFSIEHIPSLLLCFIHHDKEGLPVSLL